jgi:hypothetical protein
VRRVNRQNGKSGNPRRPSPRFRATMVIVAGLAALAMAVLAVASGEPGLQQDNVRVVAVVDALVKAVLGVGLLILAYSASRRRTGSTLGVWLVGTLAVPYVGAGLITRLPGFSVQLTLPGGNVLNSANFYFALRSVRPPWLDGVEVTIAVLCLLSIATVMASLAPGLLSRPERPVDSPDEPTSTVVTAGNKLLTAIDPWQASANTIPPDNLDAALDRSSSR